MWGRTNRTRTPNRHAGFQHHEHEMRTIWQKERKLLGSVEVEEVRAM